MEEERISRKAKLIRELVARFNGTPFIKDHIIGDHRGDSDFDKEFKYPDHISTTKVSVGSLRMELAEAAEPKSDKVVLQLHGGGYVGAFKNNYRRLAGYYIEVGVAAVLTPDYRVAPEHVFPAALHDGLKAYDWLLQRGYRDDQIIFAGDSAGGGLALAMCHYLIDRERPLPAGVIAMSPWADLAASGPSYRENYDVDPVFGNSGDDLIFENPYPGHSDVRHPYISPAYGDFSGFPPVLVQVGTREMLLSDAQTVAEKARKAGVRIRYTEYEGMFHVFQIAGHVMEESKRAWAEIAGFISRI